MGTVYYLYRSDSQTAYELGKWAWSWADTLGGGSPIIVDDAQTLAAMLALSDPDTSMDYLGRVAEDIVDWSAGMPFVFLDEHNPLIEDRYTHSKSSWWITGAAYDGSDCGYMNWYAQKRRASTATSSGSDPTRPE